jgi:hypothetical protein
MFTTNRWLILATATLAAAPVRAADLSKYLPDDTEIVIGIDIAAVKQSAVVQAHVPTLLKRFGPELVKHAVESNGQTIDADALKAVTKILGDADLVRGWLKKGGVQRYVIGTNADLDISSLCLICEGDFGKDYLKDMFAFLAKNKPFGIMVKTVTEGRHELYAVTVPGDEDQYFFALADETTVVCCTAKAALAKALDRKPRDKPAVRKELIEVARKIDPKAALWMAAAPKEADEYVDAHASVIVTDGIKLTASVTAKDADAARTAAGDIRDTFKDFAEDLDDAAKQLPPLGMLRDALKKIEPKAEKNVVTIEAGVTGAEIEKLVKELAAVR